MYKIRQNLSLNNRKLLKSDKNLWLAKYKAIWIRNVRNALKLMARFY